MNDVMTLEGKLIAEELYALLQSLDPSRRQEDTDARGRAVLQDLRSRLESLPAAQENASAFSGGVSQRLQELRRVLIETQPLFQDTAISSAKAWRRFRRRAYPAYEALAASLKLHDIHVPSLRPTNYYRNAFHISSGVTVLLIVQILLTPLMMIVVAGSFSVWAWTVEYLRRYRPGLNEVLMRMFGKMAHPHEAYRVNSATWYATALLVLALLTDKLTASMGVIVLALGDPMAAIIGRRFGRIRLVAGRSLEGTLAFATAGTLGALTTLVVFYPELHLSAAASIAASGAVAGALAELFSRRVDDNFTIPLATALGVSAARFVLGV